MIIIEVSRFRNASSAANFRSSTNHTADCLADNTPIQCTYTIVCVLFHVLFVLCGVGDGRKYMLVVLVLVKYVDIIFLFVLVARIIQTKVCEIETKSQRSHTNTEPQRSAHTHTHTTGERNENEESKQTNQQRNTKPFSSTALPRLSYASRNCRWVRASGERAVDLLVFGWRLVYSFFSL